MFEPLTPRHVLGLLQRIPFADNYKECELAPKATLPGKNSSSEVRPFTVNIHACDSRGNSMAQRNSGLWAFNCLAIHTWPLCGQGTISDSNFKDKTLLEILVTISRVVASYFKRSLAVSRRAYRKYAAKPPLEVQAALCVACLPSANCSIIF